jgi:hypothetical protein
MGGMVTIMIIMRTSTIMIIDNRFGNLSWLKTARLGLRRLSFYVSYQDASRGEPPK